jgi:hypothetical protein
MLLMFYYFRREINGYFDRIDTYSTAHPELGSAFMSALVGLGVASFCLMGGFVIYTWKIEPGRDRKRYARRVKEQLEANRPQINLLESNMESCSIMIARAQHPERIIYWLNVRGEKNDDEKETNQV